MTTSNHTVRCANTPLLDALAQAQLITRADIRAAVRVPLDASGSITGIWTATDADTTPRVIPSGLYQALYAVASQAGAARGANVVLLERGAMQVMLTDARIAADWVADAPAPVPNPGVAGATPVPVTLLAHRTDQLHPLGTFDAAAVVFGGRVATGVHVVAFRRDTHGNVVAQTAPDAPGTVLGADRADTVAELLDAAAPLGTDRVLCDLAQRQAFAASPATVQAALATQRMPIIEHSWHDILTAHVPNVLREAAATGYAYASGSSALHRALALVIFLFLSFVGALLGVMWWFFGIAPISQLAAHAILQQPLLEPWTSVLSHVPVSAPVVPATLSATLLLLAIRFCGLVPSMLEFTGFLFWTRQWGAATFKATLGVDIALCTLFYYLLLRPETADATLGAALAAQLVAVIYAVGLGILAATLFEPVLVVIVVLWCALLPVLPATCFAVWTTLAIWGARLWYAVMAGTDAIANANAHLSFQVGQVEVIDPSSGQKLVYARPWSHHAQTAITLIVLLGLFGGGGYLLSKWGVGWIQGTLK